MANFTERDDNQLTHDADAGLRGQGSIVEMMRRLKNSVIELEKSTSRQQKKMTYLTIAVVFLTVVMVIIGIIQI